MRTNCAHKLAGVASLYCTVLCVNTLPIASGWCLAEEKGPEKPERTIELKPGEKPTDLDKIDETETSEEEDQRFFPRKKKFRWVFGVTFRGITAENGDFDDKLGIELGGRLYESIDVGIGMGQLFKEGARVQTDVRSRYFLLPLPKAGGPYLGAGYLFQNGTKQSYASWYGTFGFFGGSWLFFELQFRPSRKQPLAVIPSLGLRMTLY